MMEKARDSSHHECANKFLRNVIVRYDEDPDPKFWALARKQLNENPEISSQNIHAASAAGDVTAVKTFLDGKPELVNQKGGPHNWVPLMYAAYSRLPGISTLEVGRLLVKRGADPNAHYMWGGQYRFTALTGVFGEGESGPKRQPPHPECEAFARLLLEAGADPNDSQAAYNRMFTSDDLCLKLLLEYGLGKTDKNNWYLRKGKTLIPHPDETMLYQLCHAIKSGKRDRVRLLLNHDADVNKPMEGRTPYQWALLSGQIKIAEDLLENGAKKIELRGVDIFRNALLSADKEKAQLMARNEPDLVAQVLKAHPGLLCQAVDADNRTAVAVMIELGFELNPKDTRPPLHQAAWHSHLDMIRLLIEHGADTTLREVDHFASPIGFAKYAGQKDAVALLWDYPMDAFTAAGLGHVPQLTKHLDSDPLLAQSTFEAIRPNKSRPCACDWMTMLAFAVRDQAHEAVKLLLDRGADPCVKSPEGKTLIDYANENGDTEMRNLLEGALSRS